MRSALAIGLLFCLGAWGRNVPAAEYDVAPRRLANIPPGTAIGDRAPEGWSHLIVKSRPRIGEESLREVPQTAARMATLLCTVILADVRAGADGQFVLSHVAVGLAANVKGRDLIVGSDTQAKLGANFGFLESQILAGGERQLALMRCSARSRTMAVLDGAGIVLRNKRHDQIVLRYVLLVDPRTGRLDTLAWMLEREPGRNPEPLGGIQWLPPDKFDDCVLHVDANAFILGIPTATAFAMTQMPQGRPIAFPAELKAAAAQARLGAAAAAQLDGGLRALLARQPAEPTPRK